MLGHDRVRGQLDDRERDSLTLDPAGDHAFPDGIGGRSARSTRLDDTRRPSALHGDDPARLARAMPHARFAYDPEVAARFPSVAGGVIHAEGVSNGPSSPALVEAFGAEQRQPWPGSATRRSPSCRRSPPGVARSAPSASTRRPTARPPRHSCAGSPSRARSRRSTRSSTSATSSRSATACRSRCSTSATVTGRTTVRFADGADRSRISAQATRDPGRGRGDLHRRRRPC